MKLTKNCLVYLFHDVAFHWTLPLQFAVSTLFLKVPDLIYKELESVLSIEPFILCFLELK